MNILKLTMTVKMEIVQPLTDEEAAKAKAADLKSDAFNHMIEEAKADMMAEFAKDGAKIVSIDAAVSIHEV